MEQTNVKFGWGINETHCEADTYDSVEELLKSAQESWDNMDGNPFDSDCKYSGCIYVGIARSVSPSDVAPSLDDIADQMTDKFYSENNIDDDADVQIDKRKEAEVEWKAFVEKYFDLPCTMVTSWDIGLYDLTAHQWKQKYAAFDKYVKKDRYS